MKYNINFGLQKNIKLSIIIPIYNGEKFIKKIISKVLQIKLNKEIVVVNDGSTDQSLKILQQYGEKIVLINLKKNKGISNARNLGIQNSTGNYITFIDQDDDFDLDMHAKILTKMLCDNADVGICTFDLIAAGGTFISNQYTFNFSNISQNEVIRFLLLDKIPPFLWVSVYSSDIARSIKLETDIKITNDLLYQLKVLLRAKKTCFINESLYHWIQYSTSTMHSASNVDIWFERINFSQYLTKHEKDVLENQYFNEFEYFNLYAIVMYVHAVSKLSNKKESKKLLSQIISKRKCERIIKNQYFSKIIKFEFWILKTFGIGFHLFMFPVYQLLRRIFLPKGIYRR